MLTIVNNNYVGLWYVGAAFLFFLLAGALALAIRTQLALFTRSIIPQAQAALASATASLEAGRLELFIVLERQTDLLEYQLELERLVADYAQKIVQLESVVGKEVLS